MRFRLTLFILLGITVQQLVHTVVEVWYISLLIEDFDKYNLGLTWDGWFVVHHVGSVILLILGIWLGHKWGKRYS